jgi:hypothetical protein
MKTKETLIGTVITNTGSKPSVKITNVLPANNIGHFRTEYDYVIQLDNKPEKHTIESLGLKGLPLSLPLSTRENKFNSSDKQKSILETVNTLSYDETEILIALINDIQNERPNELSN